jgi:nucleoside-diphosphate-sugar epimerase
MRCLVTGASGHLGSYLTRLLLKRGHEVAVLVRPQSNLWRISDVLSRTTLIRGDLSSIDQVEAEIISAAPEIAFHLAWYGVTSGYRYDPNQIHYNLIGSLRLLQVVQNSGCKCWVGIGSQAEYGPYNEILREDLPTQPVTVYGVTKLCVGLLSRQLCEMTAMRFLWLRLLATYGPKDDDHHLIPTVILKLLSGEKPTLTLGEQRWDYLYVEDAAEAIYQLAINSQAQGVFNLGSGEAYNVRSIVERIRDLIDPDLPLGFGEVSYSQDRNMHLQADISCLQRAIDWAPQVSLDEGLRITVDWYRNHQR